MRHFVWSGSRSKKKVANRMNQQEKGKEENSQKKARKFSLSPANVCSLADGRVVESKAGEKLFVSIKPTNFDIWKG